MTKSGDLIIDTLEMRVSAVLVPVFSRNCPKLCFNSAPSLYWPAF